MKKIKIVSGFLVLTVITMLFMSCFEFTVVEQPSEVDTGEKIEVYLEVKTDGTDENPHYGLLGFKIPSDWEITKVKMRGDYGRGEWNYLPPGTADSEPSPDVDYWTEALERIWETGNEMKWVVYETPKSYRATEEIAFADIYVDITVGETTGTFEIDYFVSNTGLSFADPDFYSVSQGNEITVTD